MFRQFLLFLFLLSEVVSDSSSDVLVLNHHKVARRHLLPPTAPVHVFHIHPTPHLTPRPVPPIHVLHHLPPPPLHLKPLIAPIPPPHILPKLMPHHPLPLVAPIRGLHHHMPQPYLIPYPIHIPHMPRLLPLPPTTPQQLYRFYVIRVPYTPGGHLPPQFMSKPIFASRAADEADEDSFGLYNQDRDNLDRDVSRLQLQVGNGYPVYYTYPNY